METTIVQRLGRVLYWLSLIIAALAVAFAALLTLGEIYDRQVVLFLGVVAAAVSYGFGRAARYILANE